MPQLLTSVVVMTVNPNYCTELSHLIRQRALTPLFQPIFNLSSTEVLGYEALIRGPSNSPLHSPLLLFKAALMCGMLEPLEMLCRQISIEAFAKAEMPGLLFLNVNPLLLLTSDHPSGLTNRLLQQVELDPSRVVIEISEQYQVEDPSVLIKAVNHYRELGFSIAIDDLGSGFSGLKLWSELKPDIVKIDRYFISQLHTDPTKRAFVQNIVALANATGSKIVAEGIETQEELLLCQELGADYGQGFLLGRPAAKIESSPPGRYLLVKQKQPYTAASEKVSAIVQFLPAIESGILAGEVMQLFSNNPDWAGLAVVESGIPVGMINRAQLLAMFAMPYGRALYEKKPIKRLMAVSPVVVDEHTSLDDVSQLVTSNEDGDNNWFFIVTSAQRYAGIGSVRLLLKKITERKLQHARYANPLTLLPGNVPIYQEVDRLLSQQINFTLAYADLNHFKPYNDIYGYSRGDLVLQLLGESISQAVADSSNFVGHVGGDDFIIIFTSDNWQTACQQIVQEFNQRIVHYYDAVHVEAGGLSAVNRSGDSCFYPLLTLSIGVVLPDPVLCVCHHDVAAIAASAKAEAKKLPAGGVFVSRRRGPATAVSILAGPLTR